MSNTVTFYKKNLERLKVDDELFEIITKALELHKKSEQWTKDKGRFIPNPSTWLNQERWNDELKIEGQGSTKYKDNEQRI